MTYATLSTFVSNQCKTVLWHSFCVASMLLPPKKNPTSFTSSPHSINPHPPNPHTSSRLLVGMNRYFSCLFSTFFCFLFTCFFCWPHTTSWLLVGMNEPF